ncbi:NACHT, LRR and PYD domains-containing protein 12-like isoform X1 [Hydra vulgaris]|uniref:NACHT, LRR and PYD domains-containing protein 12-like isoform X1 n=1 Tax=Hydra vulgaris TaxID=6087 RepID=A0ABM4B3G2_HYDVU
MDDKNYKDILLKIAVNLLDKDVEAIKFYYSKQIGDADLERITTAIKLIQTLEQRMLLGIDYYSSFVEVLTKIGRNDLVIYFLETSNSSEIDSSISAKKETSSSSETDNRVSVKKDLSRLSAELKKFYLKHYGKIGELQPLLKASANVDLIQKFVDLCVVNAANAQVDAVFSVERKDFLEKQMNYTPIPYSEIFTKEKSVILISGIAGIGKTWLLRKCLLDWSNGLIWKNVELVFYLECRRLNQHQNISNINELLNVFYKDIVNDINISNHTALFIIDGLDEFKYMNELLNSSLTCNYPIVNALKEVQKYKHVIAGRVYAIDQYQSLSAKHSNKLTIQIMGFNEIGINNYVENHVVEEKKQVVKTTLKESPIAKAMASVPFYLSSMCKIISDSKKIDSNSFLTMTDLYANIFLYFLQEHIIKNNKLVYEIMEDSSNKKYILNICKIAYKLFVENKIIFSKEDIQAFYSDFDKNEGNYFGFIEKIETDLGCYYQFAHLTIMEFCASVYAYNCLSNKEVMANKRLKSCLSMICGLANKNQNSLIKFLVNLNPLNESLPWLSSFRNWFSGNRKISHTGIIWILDRLSKSKDRKDYHDLFIECFYESQSSFTDEIKSIVDKRWWSISIDDGKTSYLTSCENYFINHYLKSGRKLRSLRVDKNILSDEEKKLLIQCSTNVRYVIFRRPINFEGWKPKEKD